MAEAANFDQVLDQVYSLAGKAKISLEKGSP
jgi:hypothetical protein